MTFDRGSCQWRTPRGGCLVSAILWVVVDDEWEVYVVDEVLAWIDGLDDATHARVVQAIDALAESGPVLGVHWSTRSRGRRCRT